MCTRKGSRTSPDLSPTLLFELYDRIGIHWYVDCLLKNSIVNLNENVISKNKFCIKLNELYILMLVRCLHSSYRSLNYHMDWLHIAGSNCIVVDSEINRVFQTFLLVCMDSHMVHQPKLTQYFRSVKYVQCCSLMHPTFHSIRSSFSEQEIMEFWNLTYIKYDEKGVICNVTKIVRIISNNNSLPSL